MDNNRLRSSWMLLHIHLHPSNSYTRRNMYGRTPSIRMSFVRKYYVMQLSFRSNEQLRVRFRNSVAMQSGYQTFNSTFSILFYCVASSACGRHWIAKFYETSMHEAFRKYVVNIFIFGIHEMHWGCRFITGKLFNKCTIHLQALEMIDLWMQIEDIHTWNCFDNGCLRISLYKDRPKARVKLELFSCRRRLYLCYQL